MIFHIKRSSKLVEQKNSFPLKIKPGGIWWYPEMISPGPCYFKAWLIFRAVSGGFCTREARILSIYDYINSFDLVVSGNDFTRSVLFQGVINIPGSIRWFLHARSACSFNLWLHQFFRSGGIRKWFHPVRVISGVINIPGSIRWFLYARSACSFNLWLHQFFRVKFGTTMGKSIKKQYRN